MGYTNSADVLALRYRDDREVSLRLWNLHLFSSGAFSNVYRGYAESDTNIPMEVVVKKTWSGSRETTSLTCYEIHILKILNRLNHPNVVRLLYSYKTQYADNTCYSLIFEFLPLNLYQYLKKHNRHIAIIETKMFAWQLFRGQFHLLRAGICHRDIKPQNLLVNENTGLLKIGDFGSSAIEPRKSPQPSYHVTRYYRPPELLLGSKVYGCEVDIWSSACVFGEMVYGAVLFPGKSTMNQMELYIENFGLPTDYEVSAMNASKSKWKEVKSRYAHKDSSKKFSRMFNISKDCPAEAVAILGRMLVYVPTSRLHGHELLSDPFFKEIFDKTSRRPCGRPIGCLSIDDYIEAMSGDRSMTGSFL
nr:Serine threonine protein kinase-related domain containing protein [Haemonchus contortus]